MKLTNKQIVYTIENSNLDLSLTGTVTISESLIINNLSGQFLTLDTKEYIGNFSYSEDTALLSKSLNSIKVSIESKASKLLDETIIGLKSTIV